MNKFWEIGEKNLHGKECYLLYLTEFYEDKLILGFIQDEESEDVFIYNSEFINVEYDTIIADNVEDAKEILESMVVDYMNEQITELEERIKRFTE